MYSQENLVSIITPSYNSEEFISETINSIINQTYTNWELLITDDFSTDNTIEIVESYVKNDSRIKLFKLEKNSGAGIARNFSINKAQGRYIAFCDSDDQWKKNKLEFQLKFMKENNLVFSFTDYDIIDEQGVSKGHIKCPKILTYNKLLKNNYVGCLTVIYDTKTLGKLLMPKIRKRQDWVLWLSIMKKIKLTKGLSTSLSIYRDRIHSISSSKFDLLKYNWSVYHKELGFNKIVSFYYLIIFIFHYFLKKAI
jgi:glycosyltransferase involved in cell wall biosynthesis